MASEIWHDCYPIILTEGQIDYMVENFQSENAISEQIKSKGYIYGFFEYNGEKIGYFGLCPREKRLMLSKFYLLKEYRGKGLGSESLNLIINYAKEKKYDFVCLTVNKENHSAIKAYERNGFVKVSSIVTEIGNGYVMDDYIMERDL